MNGPNLSRNRYHRFDWQAGAPHGELEYLAGVHPATYQQTHIRGTMSAGAIPYNRGPQPWANGFYRRYSKS
jgi:hypothetical protein